MFNRIGFSVLHTYLPLTSKPTAKTTMPKTVTKEIAMKAKRGDIFQSKTLKQGPKGARIPLRVRVTGRCQTWKRTPDHFRLPVIFGIHNPWAIDHNNCEDWETAT